MFDQTGMDTSSESLEPSRLVQSAPVAEWGQSLSEIDESFLLATMELQRAVQAALKVRVREDARALIRGVPTTPDLEVASPFTQRLMLYCGLIATTVGELSSTLPIPLVTDAGDSSRVLESNESSSQEESSEWLKAPDAEPPYGSVVMDDSGDAWQRTHEGWTCTSSGSSMYRDWSWNKLRDEYCLRLLYKSDRYY